MTLPIRINTKIHQITFPDFPTAHFNYQETVPENPSDFIRFTITNDNGRFSAFLKSADLEIAGISSTIFKQVMYNPEELKKMMMQTSIIQYHIGKIIPSIEEHLPFKHQDFFRNTAYATNVIFSCIYRKKEHLSKVPGVPEIYIHYNEPSKSAHVFINLKKTPILGRGGFGKVRKVVWIDAPANLSKIVAKKAPSQKSKNHLVQFDKELSALYLFSNKKGIISFICGGDYGDELAIFLPLYDGTLFEYSHNKSFSFPLHEKLLVALELLEGLSTISEHGIHADIKSRNILIKKGANGLEAVISDFGSYCSHADFKIQTITKGFAPPEYHKEKKLTLKHDVWGMGLSLYEFFSNHMLPFTNNSSTTKIVKLVSNLTSDWILDYRIRPDTPRFFLRLLNEMLEPIPEKRPSPKEVFERFSTKYEVFINRKKRRRSDSRTLPEKVKK